ncbi:MAG: linear amide C-N hydrolase [Firmicutes bacterium]|nr:linear amide C-N hydrolase [Bacillota bacterium]
MPKKKIKIIIALGFVLAAGLVVLGGALFADQLRAINSLRPLGTGIFFLEYRGDYGLGSFLAAGGAASDQDLARFLTGYFTKGFYRYKPREKIIGCSTLAAQLPRGGSGFGRNFDLDQCCALIVSTAPEDGYASISTTNPGFLGFEPDFDPGFGDKAVLLASVFAPLDGLNEKGFCGAILALEHEGRTSQNRGKPNLTTTAALRLLLDRAADVEEAVDLLSRYDLHASADQDYHFALADASGRAVVVEYIQGEMYVTETAVVTNHFLTEGDYRGVGRNPGDFRQETLEKYLELKEGILSPKDFKEALAAAAQKDRISTQWSIFYDLGRRELFFYHQQDFTSPFPFNFSSPAGVFQLQQTYSGREVKVKAS